MTNEEKDFLEEETVDETVEETVEEFEEDDMLIEQDPSSPTPEANKPKSYKSLILIGIVVGALVACLLVFGFNTTTNNTSLVCDYVYDTMTLTQTLEYNDEDGVVAMSNILSQVLTEDELDSYGLTFEEYVAENETSFAEMEEIAGATFTISSDADTLTITIGLRIDFETYDFETDVYALGSTDNYADVDTIESTLVAYGYTCETIE